MTTLKRLALALAGFFLIVPVSAAQAATMITYDLKGRIDGSYDVISDPTATPQDFTGVYFNLQLFGDLPGDDLGATDLVHLSGGQITIGHHTKDFTLGPHAFFGADELTGHDAFGRLNASGFHPEFVFGAPALVGYDGMGDFGPHHVWVNVRHPFDVTFGGKTVRFDITDFDRGRFSAYVPEPAAWALMLMGFAGAGASLRRRRASALA